MDIKGRLNFVSMSSDYLNNNKESEIRYEILTKPIFRLLIKKAVSTIIGMLVTVIYNLTDTFFVSLLDNSSMIAAIGVVFSFLSIIQAIGFWFGYGSGNIMSKKIGEKNTEEAEIFSTIGIIFAIVSGILIAIFSRIYVLPLSRVLGGFASNELFIFTVEYLKVIIISIPFSLYAITIYNQLRLCGNAKDGMIGLLIGMVVNLIFDPIFIFSLEYGFVGSAYATLIGHIIACITLTILAGKKRNTFSKMKKIKFTKSRIYHVLLGGIPNFARQSITSISLILLNTVSAQYGDSMIASITISTRILAFAQMIAIGWCQGFQPICAMNYGAKQYERVKKAFNYTVFVGTIFLVISSLILFIYAQDLIGIMTSDNEVLMMGSHILRLQCIVMPLLGYYAVSGMYMQNIGKYFIAMIITISRQGIFFIPLLYIMSEIFGKNGIYLLQPISDTMSFILAFILVKKYKDDSY